MTMIIDAIRASLDQYLEHACSADPALRHRLYRLLASIKPEIYGRMVSAACHGANLDATIADVIATVEREAEPLGKFLNAQQMAGVVAVIAGVVRGALCVIAAATAQKNGSAATRFSFSPHP